MTRPPPFAALATLGLAASLAAPSAHADVPPPALRCTLQAPATVPAGGPAPLTFTLVNEGAVPLRVLRWGTPWEGRWTAAFVSASRDGRPMAYAGPAVKRADPGPDAYLAIAPGASVAGTADLAQPFDLSIPGTVSVTVHLRLHDVIAGDAPASRPRARHRSQDLDCTPSNVQIRVR